MAKAKGFAEAKGKLFLFIVRDDFPYQQNSRGCSRATSSR